MYFGSAFLWTTFQYVFSTSWNHQQEFHSPKANQWGFTQACGTQMTGQPEVALSRLTGLKLLSSPPTETLRPMPVYGLAVSRAVIRRTLPPLRTPRGRIKGLTPLAGTGSGGCSRNTWFTTTALTWNGSLKASLLSATALDFYERYHHLVFKCTLCSNSLLNSMCLSFLLLGTYCYKLFDSL